MSRIQDIGEIREDGSILLYDENISRREGLPRRIRQTAPQKQKLAEWGFKWVNSSFISGIAEQDDDLLIRFHNGSYYRYIGFGSHLDKMFQAPSKGRYFWRNIRGTRNYVREGELPFPNDLQIEDTDLFKEMASQFNKVVMDMVRLGVTKVIFDQRTQREYLKVSYRGEVIFLNILPD